MYIANLFRIIQDINGEEDGFGKFKKGETVELVERHEIFYVFHNEDKDNF